MYQSGSRLFSILTSHGATKQHRLFLIDKNSPLDGLRRFGPELGNWQVHLEETTVDHSECAGLIAGLTGLSNHFRHILKRCENNKKII
jgi:hypothetical protein